MDKITKEQFNKALLICDKYLSQEKDKILFIENKIIEINQQKEIITEHTTLSSWFKLKKGDIIKLLRTGGNANTKIKQGDLLTVTQLLQNPLNKDDIEKAQYEELKGKFEKKEK